jgi:putative SOS response-associated peptidase YedK
MCTRYISPDAAAIERAWHVGRDHSWRGGELFPRAAGAFIRADRESAGPRRELVVGQWGLVPWFAKSAKLAYSTVNARFEEVAGKPSYKESWARGRRCIIPAASFDEPCWETGRNVWWRFRRADGTPWGLAGLWNTWVDKSSGEIVESYTMLTINADAHPIMRRMHKPDPKLGPDRQDKRSVVAIEREDADRWLFGTEADARSLVQLTPAECMEAGPASAPAQGTLD